MATITHVYTYRLIPVELMYVVYANDIPVIRFATRKEAIAAVNALYALSHVHDLLRKPFE